MSGGERAWSGRPHPALLLGGAGILFGRTVALVVGGATAVLRPWVVALTFVEMALDAVTMIGSLRWWVSRSTPHSRLPLRSASAATLLHAARVLVFVLGRTGPWVDLDVRPEQRAGHGERWTWSQVVFAGVLSILGVVGVVVVWRVGRRTARAATDRDPVGSLQVRAKIGPSPATETS